MTDPTPLDAPAVDAIVQSAYADAYLEQLADTDIYYRVGRDGQIRLVDLTDLAARPTEKRGTATITRPADFARYVTGHHGDGTQVYVDHQAGTAVALIDGHGNQPGHGRHIARLQLRRHPAFDRIASADGRTLTQEEMANWVDDIAEEITPGQLAGEDIAALVDSLHVHANSNQKEVRASGHGRQIIYQEDVTISSGPNSVELPNKIKVTSPVWDGVPKAWTFEIRLSVIAKPGQPTKFKLQIPRLRDVLEAATTEAIDVAQEDLPETVPVFAGAFQPATRPTPQLQ